MAKRRIYGIRLYFALWLFTGWSCCCGWAVGEGQNSLKLGCRAFPYMLVYFQVPHRQPACMYMHSCPTHLLSNTCSLNTLCTRTSLLLSSTVLRQPHAPVTAPATAALALRQSAIQGTTITASTPTTRLLCGARSHRVSGQLAGSCTQATGRPHSSTSAMRSSATRAVSSSRAARLRLSVSCTPHQPAVGSGSVRSSAGRSGQASVRACSCRSASAAFSRATDRRCSRAPCAKVAGWFSRAACFCSVAALAARAAWRCRRRASCARPARQ